MEKYSIGEENLPSVIHQKYETLKRRYPYFTDQVDMAKNQTLDSLKENEDCTSHCSYITTNTKIYPCIRSESIFKDSGLHSMIASLGSLDIKCNSNSLDDSVSDRSMSPKKGLAFNSPKVTHDPRMSQSGMCA